MPNVEHSLLTGTSVHEAKRYKEPVRVASTANVTLSGPGSAIDGVTLSVSDRVLLKDQSTASQNGIYLFQGAASALTRATDADEAADYFGGFLVYVSQGTTLGTSIWRYTTVGAITLGSTSLTFTRLDGGFPNPMTTLWDLIVGGVSGAGSRLGVGTVGQVLSVLAGPSVGWSRAVDVMTAVGDIIIGGTAGLPTRLAAGTAGYVLTSSGTSSAPTWSVATGGSGGSSSGGTGGSIVPIQTQTPTTSAVTFVVPAGFKNLRITGTGRSDAAASTANLLLTFNSDGTTNYDYQFNPSGGAGTSTAASSITIGRVAASSAGTSSTGAIEIEIPDHANTSLFKSAVSHGQIRIGSANQGTDSSGGQWRSTAAITSVTLTLSSGVFVTGTTFTLWGEADTAPVLLTSNSNLLYETTLAASATTIDTGILSQGYRDLMVTAEVRGTTAATSVAMNVQFNGDTTATSYDAVRFFASSTSGSSVAGQPAASALIGDVAAASAPANQADSIILHLPGYSATTFRKTGFANSTVSRSDTVSGNQFIDLYRIGWRSTSAITSMKFALASGDFAAGSTVRVYGLPAAAAGPSVGTGTKLRISANQSITSATASLIAWDTEDNDADNQHYTSAANLTGTVTKTAGTTTLTGSGTAFTTELSVGQVISVPGTAAEKRVVVSIASATSLTVNTAYANSASGQTAARVNTAIVFRQPGFYAIEVGIYSAALASGAVTLGVVLNDVSTPIKQIDPTAINASAGYGLSLQRQFQMWDFIEVAWTQNSGGAVNVLTDERTHISVASRPTVIVAVPYANIQDQKTQNTAGGTFTSGAWQTRALNTAQSDSAGIAPISSNQITLGPGTYRTRGICPAFNCGNHQTRIQNITDAATLLTGMSMSSSSTSESLSEVTGKFALTGTKVIELQHRCTVNRTTDGFGIAANLTTEVYSIIEIWKEG